MKPAARLASERLLMAARAYSDRLLARSLTIARFFESGMVRIALLWLALTGVMAIIKAANPAGVVHDFGDAAQIYVAYAAVILAPIAGFMLIRVPGVFVAGEMLDWEAPTGGYLLTACLATGRAAARGVISFLENRPLAPS